MRHWPILSIKLPSLLRLTRTRRGRPAKPAQKKERPVRKARQAVPPQRKDTESEEEETESEQETEVETETEIIYEENKLELLERFCVYAVKFYILFFLTANIGADAAVTDLILYKKLRKFSQVDRQLADEALATLSRHLWFLAPTTVLFSLASEKLEDDDKSRIVVRLLKLPKPKEMHCQPFLSCLTRPSFRISSLLSPGTLQYPQVVS